jgi:hypothetical protein
MSIQQQAMIPASPAQVYAVLADANALSALSGMPGVPGRSAGEEFSAFDGHVGRCLSGNEFPFGPCCDRLPAIPATWARRRAGARGRLVRDIETTDGELAAWDRVRSGLRAGAPGPAR